MRSFRPIRYLVCLTVVSALSGCDLAPLYTPPSMILPAQYKGSGPFVVAQPQDQLSHGPWWQVFGNAELDRLETQLDAANPNLKAAEETYTQARDVVGEARSGLFPQLGLQAFTSENKESVHTLFKNATSASLQSPSNGYGAVASWEPDFWSQIRNSTKEAQQDAQGVAAQVASARLSLEMELATDYMAIHGLDDEHAVYVQTIASYQQAVSITQLRFAGKIAAGIDVARAENQLSSAQAFDTEVQAQRALLEHAVAVLAGVNPSTFSLPASADAQISVPTTPVDAPSALLQRRPDIAQAERMMAAENSSIGVSRAAFYPNIRLSAIAGFEDTGFGLASLPNALWAVGASAMLPLFEGGLRKAELQQSWSQFNQATDSYRATVLQAFQQVEDNLTLTSKLATEATQQEAALQAALKVQDMSLSLYTGGLDNYLSVTVAQIAALTAQISEVEVQTRRLQTAVGLIGAFGGGWSTADLPTAEQTLPFNPLSPHDAPGDVHEPH
ncbi:efflux transporter outer membrane subunit [Pararobbsia alpina]|uniref:Outer membrane protein OprM n=1 Tax=Pararobbsia alpina TaxID=621374 RepID=A0A6S7CMM3_9BURK|nr:efflux transporter outer membrane subunit [Pararobbsia alpina]CAB3783671.1 Outer membrane protein OprM [Pararobbsia alpina]